VSLTEMHQSSGYNLRPYFRARLPVSARDDMFLAHRTSPINASSGCTSIDAPIDALTGRLINGI